MTPVFPTTELKTNYREIKDATREGLAIITEGGRGQYAFESEAAFDEELDSAAWEAANTERIMVGIDLAMAQFESGEFIEGLEEGIAYSEKLRLSRA